MNTSSTDKAYEVKGRYVVMGIFLLTAIVGSFFIYLGPKATAKTPGIVHVGLRFSDEQTINFLRYGKKGPEGMLEFIAADGTVVYKFDQLRMGRNLVPIEAIESGRYTARISSADYNPVELPVLIEGRMLNPTEDYASEPDKLVDYNMIGTWLRPKR